MKNLIKKNLKILWNHGLYTRKIQEIKIIMNRKMKLKMQVLEI